MMQPPGTDRLALLSTWVSCPTIKLYYTIVTLPTLYLLVLFVFLVLLKVITKTFFLHITDLYIGEGCQNVHWILFPKP